MVDPRFTRADAGRKAVNTRTEQHGGKEAEEQAQRAQDESSPAKEGANCFSCLAEAGWEAETPIRFKPNNKREGSLCHARYEAYSKAGTLGEALALGAKRSDLNWDYKHGMVFKVDDGKDASEALRADASTSPAEPVSMSVELPVEKTTPQKRGLKNAGGGGRAKRRQVAQAQDGAPVVDVPVVDTPVVDATVATEALPPHDEAAAGSNGGNADGQEPTQPDAFVVSCHSCPLVPFDNGSGTWYCNNQSDFCTRAVEGPKPRWSCRECCFDLCRGCLEHWRAEACRGDQQPAADEGLEPRDVVVSATTEVVAQDEEPVEEAEPVEKEEPAEKKKKKKIEATPETKKKDEEEKEEEEEEEWPRPAAVLRHEASGAKLDHGGRHLPETRRTVACWTADTLIRYKPHAKRPGTKSSRRYNRYAVATTVGEALRLGARVKDWCWDWQQGYIKVLGGPVRDEPLVPGEKTSGLTNVDKVLLRWIKDYKDGPAAKGDQATKEEEEAAAEGCAGEEATAKAKEEAAAGGEARAREGDDGGASSKLHGAGKAASNAVDERACCDAAVEKLRSLMGDQKLRLLLEDCLASAVPSPSKSR